MKSLNWEILTKNLVTFKRWDGVRMKNFNGDSLMFGGFTKNQHIEGNCLKGGLRQFADLRGDLAKKRGLVLLRGVIPQCTL